MPLDTFTYYLLKVGFIPPLRAHLASRNNIVLGENALKILKLQSEGKSSADIAKELKISEATVKYHNKETYRKLGVRNKAAAITEARKRKLI